MVSYNMNTPTCYVCLQLIRFQCCMVFHCNILKGTHFSCWSMSKSVSKMAPSDLLLFEPFCSLLPP